MKKLITITIMMLIITSCGKQKELKHYDYTINVMFNDGVERQIHYQNEWYYEFDFSLTNKKGTTYLKVYICNGSYLIASDVMYFDIVNVVVTPVSKFLSDE